MRGLQTRPGVWRRLPAVVEERQVRLYGQTFINVIGRISLAGYCVEYRVVLEESAGHECTFPGLSDVLELPVSCGRFHGHLEPRPLIVGFGSESVYPPNPLVNSNLGFQSVAGEEGP